MQAFIVLVESDIHIFINLLQHPTSSSVLLSSGSLFQKVRRRVLKVVSPWKTNLTLEREPLCFISKKQLFWQRVNSSLSRCSPMWSVPHADTCVDTAALPWNTGQMTVTRQPFHETMRFYRSAQRFLIGSGQSKVNREKEKISYLRVSDRARGQYDSMIGQMSSNPRVSTFIPSPCRLHVKVSLNSTPCPRPVHKEFPLGHQ